MAPDIERLPEQVYLAEQVRELDRVAIEEYGIPGFDLMRRAARFSFHSLMQAWPNTENIVLLCGAGNNAGDGYLVGHIAQRSALSLTCFALADPKTLKGDAELAYSHAFEHGLTVQPYTRSALEECIDTTHKHTVIVDALLGTGLAREVAGDYAQAIDLVNNRAFDTTQHSDLYVLSIDIPSGLDANTGQAHGTCIKANLTTTFIGNKLGLMTGSGRHYAGQIDFHSLDIPEHVYRRVTPALDCPSLPNLLSELPPRAAYTHKGKLGRSLLIGGNLGYAGAIFIASQACTRLGSGLTSVVTQEAHCLGVTLHQPEVMAHTQTSHMVDELFKGADCIAIGPGLGKDAWSYQLLTKSFSFDGIKVLDADALNLLADDPELSSKLNAKCVITPHPGEAARLLSASVQEVEANRLESARDLQSKFGCHVVLKGSGTLIVHPSGSGCVIRYGNPGMASGGMGDALTGMLCSLLTQHRDATPVMMEQLVRLSVALHSAAADRLAARSGVHGILASDLSQEARALLNGF